MLKTKWFIYTVIVGLIPFIVRLCVFLSLQNKNVSVLFDPLDFVVLGLVINITNINQLEGDDKIDKIWKTKCIGLSIIFIIVYAVLFAISVIYSINTNIFNKSAILVSSIILSVASVYYGFSVFNRLDNIGGNEK